MEFDWSVLLKAMPIVVTSVDPRAGVIASAIGELVASEVTKAQAVDPNKTLDDLIDEALASIAQSDADLDEGLRKARELRQLGHEAE